MADPIVNFFKSTLVGTYSNTDTSFTIATGDGALLPDPSTDGEYNLTIFRGLQVNANTTFEIVRVTAKSGDVLTVTRQQEGTSALTVDSEVHSILMSATKKTFDDINTAISNVNVTTLTGVETLSFDTSGNESFSLPSGDDSERPATPINGNFRYNDARHKLEAYVEGEWRPLELGQPYFSFQGTNFAFTSGGYTSSSGTSNVNTIDKFSIASGGNASDVGDLTQSIGKCSGGSSNEHGYRFGGDINNTRYSNTDKFSFASGGNASYVGAMTQTKRESAGQSSGTHVFCACGDRAIAVAHVEKFSTSSDGNAQRLFDTTRVSIGVCGQSSETHGYTSAGGNPQNDSTPDNIVDKYEFGTDTSASDVGDLTLARQNPSGQSSSTHGYTTGGNQQSSAYNRIDKFTFASDNNATDVGDLGTTNNCKYGAGSSGESYGYHTAGCNTSQSPTNRIDRIDFATDGNSTNVGTLTVNRYSSAGHQY